MHRVNSSHARSGKLLQTTIDDDFDVKEENTRLRRQIKEQTAKRNMCIKQCTELTSKVQELQQQAVMKDRKSKDQADRNSNEGYRVEQLHFLNRELNGQIQQLRSENRELLEKYKRSANQVESRYEELERNTFKNIQLAMKRVKKTVMYLNTLSGKEIEKTRSSMVDNLEKSLDLLKGKYLTETYEQQVKELMSPLSALKEDLIKKEKELKSTKLLLEEMQASYSRESKLNKNILPQYKMSIEELQKNLSVCRSQIAELELEKLEYRRKYEIRIKELEEQNRELINSFTKLKLQRKLYSDRIREIEGEAEEEKERLIDQNEMLKALYKTKSNELKTSSMSSSYLVDPKVDQTKNFVDKSRKSSKSKMTQSRYSQKEGSSLMSSAYQSQNTLKQEIEQIDKEIYEIQNNLMKQLQAYKHK